MRSLQRFLPLVSGIAIGVIASLIASYLWSEYDRSSQNHKIAIEAARELNARLLASHQATVMGTDPVASLEIISELYNGTRSHTDNDAFEGKRLENLTFIIADKTRDNTIKALLERIKFIKNDLPIELSFGLGDKERMRNDPITKERVTVMQEKIHDYSCCIKGHYGIEEGFFCSLEPDYYKKFRYCVFKGEVTLPPDGLQVILQKPVDYEPKPGFYR